MSPARILLCCLGPVTLTSCLLAAPPLPLDLIPEEACAGIAARNLTELRTKSDRVFGKIPERRFPERPSQFLDTIVKNLNLGWTIDEKKPVALLCLSGTLAGFAADADPEKSFTAGMALAPKDLEELARVHKLTVDKLKQGKVHNIPGQERNRFFDINQAGYRDGQVFMTGSAKATAAWMKAPMLRQGQTATRQRHLDAADGVVYLGPPLLWMAQKNFDPETVNAQMGLQEADAQRRLNRAYLEARTVLAGYRIDDGFGLDLSVGFDPKGKNSQAVLKAITGAGRTSNLKGLPDSERLVGAFAAIGLERTDLHLARVLASDLWYSLRGNTPILDTDAHLTRRIFGDLYSRVRLAKLAVYQSSNSARSGRLTAVLVLEPTDPGQFLTEVSQYARLGDVEQFDPKLQASKPEIEKLVGDLGSDEFEIRESASTKLGLIGDEALPYLEKATKSDDAEVRRRADDLRRAIQIMADMRKMELAEGLVKKAFHPTFTLKLNAEKRADANIHLLGMRFDADAAPYTAALKEFLGPDWNRIRIAVVNKQVVVLIGSDMALFEQAIQNVRDGKPGLEQSPILAEFYKQAAPERRVELHVALSRLQALVTPMDKLPDDFKPTGACSSVAVRTGAAELGLDLWVPSEAVGDVLMRLR